MKNMFIILQVCLLTLCAGTLFLYHTLTDLKTRETSLIEEQEILQTKLTDAGNITREKEEAIRQKESTVQSMKEEYAIWEERTEEVRSYLP